MQELVTILTAFLKSALLAEFTAQGHTITGKAVNDLSYVIDQTVTATTVNYYMESYTGILNKGTPASRIPFSGVSHTGGKKTSLYIAGLIKFIKSRGMATDDKKALGIAIAIAKKQKKEGMPTKNSYIFSKNGSRLSFIDFTLLANEQKLAELVQRYFSIKFTYIIEQFTTQWQS